MFLAGSWPIAQRPKSLRRSYFVSAKERDDLRLCRFVVSVRRSDA